MAATTFRQAGNRLLAWDDEHDQLDELVVADWPNAKVLPEDPGTVRTDAKASLPLTVQGTCTQYLSTWVPRLRVIAPGRPASTGQLVEGIRDGNHWQFIHQFASARSYRVQLELTRPASVVGAPFFVDVKEPIQAGSRPWGSYAAALAAAHALVVCALVADARYRKWCFNVLFDPIWKAALLYVYIDFLVRHSRLLQLWLLARYFDTVRTRQKDRLDEPYEPLTLSGPRAATRLADASVLSELRAGARLRVQGPTGMGKTAFTRHLEHAYYGQAADAFGLLRARGHLSVFIPTRRYRPSRRTRAIPRSG